MGTMHESALPREAFNQGQIVPYLNLDLDYWTNRKTVRLIGLLGVGAEILPLRLWTYVAKHHPETGHLKGYMAEELESAAGWTGIKGKMVDAMLTVGFLENIGDGFKVHGWLDHAGHLAAFKKRAKTAAKRRWRNYALSKPKQTITNAPNLSVPILSEPTQIKDSPRVSPEPTVSVKDFSESWNRCFTGKLPAIRLPLSESRYRKLKLRLKEHPTEQFWTEVFSAIAASDFLMGRNGSDWRVSFDWLIDNDKNCLKVAEGNYANKH
jgi:hypothetical protein